LKRYLFILMILAGNVISLPAQELVYPNQPEEIIRSTRGFITMLEFNGGLGMANGEASYSKNFAGINIQAGYQLSRYFIVSAGTGFSAYSDGNLIPFYADIRYIVIIRKLSPFLFGDGGLLFSSAVNQAMFINPGFGVRYSLSRRFALTFAGGMYLQTSDQNMLKFINVRSGVTYKF
jgi:hypothetical protein